MKRFFVYLFFVIVAIVFVTVGVYNLEIVRVTLLPEWFPFFGGFGLSLPLFVHLFIALFSGMLLGFFFEYLREYRYRSQARRAKRELAKTQKQLDKTKEATGQHDDEILAIVK